MADTPENNPTPPEGSTPDSSAEAEGRQTDPQAEAAPADGNAAATPASTQSNLGDGAGIRGSYGDASQTNGLEGGPDSAADGSPEKKG